MVNVLVGSLVNVGVRLGVGVSVDVGSGLFVTVGDGVSLISDTLVIVDIAVDVVLLLLHADSIRRIMIKLRYTFFILHPLQVKLICTKTNFPATAHLLRRDLSTHTF